MTNDESHNPPDREPARSSDTFGDASTVRSAAEWPPHSIAPVGGADVIQAELGEMNYPADAHANVPSSDHDSPRDSSALQPGSSLERASQLYTPPGADGTYFGWTHGAANRPRIWTALAVAVLALPLGWVVSLVVTWCVLAATVGTQAIRTPAMFSAEMKEMTATPLGLVVMALPGQLTFLACALGAAALSPVPWRERLGLGRGTFPLWSWPVLAFATPVVAFITSLTLGVFMNEPSDHMLWMEKLFREQPLSFLPVLILLIGVLPGLGEELLYRGYVQGRLSKVWPAGLSIMLTSVIFGLAHVDPTHALHVIPLGIWLGVLSWRTESLWPSILGHAANNSLALVMMRMIDRSTKPPTVDPAVGFLVLGALGSFVIALVLLIISGRPLTWRDIFRAPRHS